MSIRVDSSPLIAGAVVVGDPGLGVLAEAVPSTGEHGAGYLFPSLEFPTDTGKEVRGLITTWPTLGTLTAFEDSSFEYDGPSDTFAFQMYVDGVATGTPQTVTITVGAQVSITAVTASNITQTGATITVTRSNPAAGTLYFVIVPQGVTPSWSRANVGTNSGWTATTIAYHDADTDPGTGSTYVFTPDASGLTASTAYDLWAVWDDGVTTVGPVQGTTFETLAATANLTPQDASHAHTTDNLTLSVGLSLAVQDALHAHTADAPTLSANTPDSLTLSVADATHAHLADALVLAGSHTLGVQSATHSHAVEALSLSAALNLLVDNALHAQLADNAALSDSVSASLVAQNASHSHLADALTLSGALALIVQDAQHAHLSEQATLSAAHSLVAQNAAHAHLADVVDASSGLALTITNAFHAHLADNVDADTALSLAIHDALHTHQAEAATLTAALTLIVSDAIHAHFADQAEFFIPVPLVDQLRRSVFLRIAQQRPFVRVEEQRVFIRVQ